MHAAHKNTLLPLLVAGLAAFGSAVEVWGQNPVMLDPNATRCEIFRALSAQVPPECAMDKGIVFLNPSTPAPAKPSNAAQPVPNARYAFDTPIPFEFDSGRLTPEARNLLDELAGVLKDPLMASKIIRIEGHTDSVGTADYNLKLSQKRAQAVQQYLVRQHRIPARRIPAAGKGESEPRDPQQPESEVNRRVQFINLSDSAG